MTLRLRRRTLRRLLLGLAALAALVYQQVSTRRGGAPTGESGAAAVAEAFDARRSNVVLEVTGTVTRVLPPDRDDTPHQRFILELDNGMTVLVAHNLVLARAVPLSVGDPVTVRGEYEWNDRGGVIHWTHDDPGGRHPGGWILHRGTRYR